MKVILLFILSVLLTAIFSYSLQVFLEEDYITLTFKTMLVPCFTWLVLLVAAFRSFNQKRFQEYGRVAGWVCVVGSAALIPAGIYNFISLTPDVAYSVANVLVCVLIMSVLFYVLLRRYAFSIKWWWAYNALICVNMSIFYFVAKN